VHEPDISTTWRQVDHDDDCHDEPQDEATDADPLLGRILVFRLHFVFELPEFLCKSVCCCKTWCCLVTEVIEGTLGSSNSRRNACCELIELFSRLHADCDAPLGCIFTALSFI
jgi:hypothetical protein